MDRRRLDSPCSSVNWKLLAYCLANTTGSDKSQVRELNAFIEAESLRIPTVLVGEKNGQAIARTEHVKVLEAPAAGPAATPGCTHWLAPRIACRAEINSGRGSPRLAPSAHHT